MAPPGERKESAVDRSPSEGWKLGHESLDRLLAEARGFKGESLWRDAWRRLRANRAAFYSLVFLALFCLVSWLAPAFPIPSPATIRLEEDLEPPGHGEAWSEAWQHRTRIVFRTSEPLSEIRLDRLRTLVEDVSGRNPAREVGHEADETGHRSTWSVPFDFDDARRVDYTRTGRSGRVRVVRSLSKTGGSSHCSFELPIELDDILEWSTQSERGKVTLDVKTLRMPPGVVSYRYTAWLANAEKAPPEALAFGEVEVAPIGNRADLAAARAMAASAEPPADIRLRLRVDGREIALSPRLTALVVADPRPRERKTLELLEVAVRESVGREHPGLAAAFRGALPGAGVAGVELAEVDPNGAYWRLNFFDRGLLALRARLFGLSQTGNYLGTDLKGRDVLSRIIWGSRKSILVAVAATLCSLIIGVTYGAFSGLMGGRIDNLMMRIVDILYSIPFIFVVIFLITLITERRIELEERFGVDRELILYVVIGAIYWLTMARVVRGQVLSLKHTEFIEATRVLGASTLRVLFVHIVPNVLSVVIVYLTLTIPAVMLFEAFLSFLGLGIEPPKVSWGLLAVDGTEAISPVKIYWWLVVFPAAAMATTLLALNILGDGLRDALDPKLRGKD